ncbi:MAG TPA: SulP family inorganic anion transporter [Thermoanaerobaculia bacterium]|nr:SulP family inorganic anion transporter [Thermoanaerobaculia bacterium]
MNDFLPKSLEVLRGYSRNDFLRDLSAGVVVGIVALPLALAFAIASGVPPERGLYTAIVAGFIISALGGSSVQIGGPTGAFVVIVYGIVTKYGYQGLVLATLLAGLILIILGLARMGSLIRFIPHPLVTGFTSGIAVIIFSSQMKDLLGLHMGSLPPDFIEKWVAISTRLSTLTPAAVGVATATLLTIILWPRAWRRIPAPFAAMLLATIAVRLLDLPVETIGSRFGGVPSSLPSPGLPPLQLDTLRHLVSPAFTIALLAAIESLLSAVVADGMTGDRHNSNAELIAQGIANIASSIFGGIPATGAIARTATNIKAGARTPVAGVVHALTLLLILIFAGKWAAMVPLASLAAILVVVAYHMSEWRSFASLLRAPRGDVVVLLLTFALTILVDLTIAVEVGIVVAALLFLRRMTDVTTMTLITDEVRALNDPADLGLMRERRAGPRIPIPPGVEIVDATGPFFFAVAEKIQEVLSDIGGTPLVFILRMRQVPALDATGMYALETLARRCRAQGTTLILCEMQRALLRKFIRAQKVSVFGRQNFKASLGTAVERAKAVIDAGGAVT